MLIDLFISDCCRYVCLRLKFPGNFSSIVHPDCDTFGSSCLGKLCCYSSGVARLGDTRGRIQSNARCHPLFVSSNHSLVQKIISTAIWVSPHERISMVTTGALSPTPPPVATPLAYSRFSLDGLQWRGRAMCTDAKRNKVGHQSITVLCFDPTKREIPAKCPGGL